MRPELSVEQKGFGSVDSSADKWIDISLFLGDKTSPNPIDEDDRQRLMLEAAAIADEHDFCAVWLPEDAPAVRAKRVAIRAVAGVLPAAVDLQTPVWVAVGKESDLFKAAAQSGARVLTHLLGRSIESLAKDISLYRRTWIESGHPGSGYVTLVVPTLAGEDEAAIKPAALKAMRQRVRADHILLHEAAWDFPEFVKASEEQGTTLAEFFSSLTAEQLDALVQFAAEQYVAKGGLFGTRSGCLALVERLKQIGVDEIACLIDFGWPASLALEHLPALNELRLASNQRRDESLAASNDPMALSDVPAAQRPPAASGTETQHQVAKLWERVLDVPKAGPADNFFDLGGHSLLAARTVSEIEQSFGARLSIKTLMISSLSQVAAEIDRLADRRCPATGRNGAEPEAAPKSENSNVGRLASWFKNSRTADRFQDG